MSTYKIYTSVNYAETSRDPDDIHENTLAISDNLDEARQCAQDYIRRKFFHKDTELNKIDDGGRIKYRAHDFRSWGETIIVEDISKNYLSTNG